MQWKKKEKQLNSNVLIFFPPPIPGSLLRKYSSAARRSAPSLRAFGQAGEDAAVLWLKKLPPLSLLARNFSQGVFVRPPARIHTHKAPPSALNHPPALFLPASCLCSLGLRASPPPSPINTRLQTPGVRGVRVGAARRRGLAEVLKVFRDKAFGLRLGLCTFCYGELETRRQRRQPVPSLLPCVWCRPVWK